MASSTYFLADFDCCAHGGYKKEGHGPVCQEAGVIVKKKKEL
jgi:hypothetical protein